MSSDLSKLMKNCWNQTAKKRPDFSFILAELLHLYKTSSQNLATKKEARNSM